MPVASRKNKSPLRGGSVKATCYAGGFLPLKAGINRPQAATAGVSSWAWATARERRYCAAVMANQQRSTVPFSK